MTRLHGTYVRDDIVLRDRAVARFVARHGLARGIMDFTDVDGIEVSIDRVVRRAHEPPVLAGQPRIIVAPDALTYELNRVVTAHQLYSRKVEPLLVRTLDEAFHLFGMDDPQFEPIANNAADDLDDSMTRVLSRIDETLDNSAAAADGERQNLRRKLMRLFDTVPAAGPNRAPRAHNTITMGDVVNAALNRSAVSDDDIGAICPQCRHKTSLGLCKVVTGRETAYHCPRCESVLMTLAPTGDDTPLAPEKAYRLGAFLVRTAVDLDCPGARLPRSS